MHSSWEICVMLGIPVSRDISGCQEPPLLTFLYVTVRSMPGPSRVVFFLVVLNSARREQGRTEISPILPVCGQQRGVLSWDKPFPLSCSSHGLAHQPSSPRLWELRLCELNRSSETHAFEGLPTTAMANMRCIDSGVHWWKGWL